MCKELIEFRERMGLTQAATAVELGIQPNTYARRERGELDQGNTVFLMAMECMMWRKGLMKRKRKGKK